MCRPLFLSILKATAFGKCLRLFSGQPYIIQLNGTVYQAVLQSVNLGGDSELIVTGYGVPDSGGTIVITSGGTTKTINVDAATGKATIL